MCYFTYTFLYELFCMKLYETCCRRVVGLNITLDVSITCFLAGDASCLCFPFQAEYYYRFPRGTPHFMCVRTAHAPSLTCRSYHILATNRDILLASVKNSSQGIIVRPTVRTPTPNGPRSNWDFLSGRFPDMLVGPELSIGPYQWKVVYLELHPI